MASFVSERERRRRRRVRMLFVYPLLWLLTFVGVWSAEPTLFGIPLWYVWAAVIVVLLVPLNAYFARACWPVEAEDEPRG